MKPSEVLRGARIMISDRHKWTQGAFARGRLGGICESRSPMAVCWCAAGAVENAVFDRSLQDKARDRLSMAASALGYPNDIRLNDLTNHATVMRMFDYAIKLAEEAGE